MDLNLLKRKTDREGFLKKAASAKGEDKFRGGWQERWFVLSSHNFEYYKRKGDSKPKGTIDLRAAKVEDADSKTDAPFTIWIAQSKQIFTYIQCSSEQDKEEWLEALRKGAGYKTNVKSSSKIAPKTQKDSYCSFSVLYTTNVSKPPELMTLIIDANDKSLKLFDKQGRAQQPFPAASIANVIVNQEPSRPLNAETLLLYAVNIDFKADNYLNRKIIWVGSHSDAKDLGHILENVAHGSFAPVTLILRQPEVETGFIHLRHSKNDSKWEEVYVILMEGRCLVFKDRKDVVPTYAISLKSANFMLDGSTGLTVQGALDRFVFRMVDSALRDRWHRFFVQASETLKDRLNKVRVGEAKDPLPGPPPTSLSPRAIADEKRELASTDWEGVHAKEILDKANTFIISWGEGAHGQLGHRTKDSLISPTVISALNSKRVRYISAGQHHAGAVTHKGHVYMWGGGDDYQLGLGENRTQTGSPYLLTSLARQGVTRIACGRAHTLALTHQHTVFSWGCGASGQLGTGGQASVAYPKTIEALSDYHVTSIHAGGDQSAAVTKSGDVYVWGRNTDAQLGMGTTDNIKAPQRSDISQKGAIKEVALGDKHSAFVARDGKLYTCGDNEFGQLGLGDTKARGQPQEVTLFSNGHMQVKSVVAGEKHTVAIVDTPDAKGCLFTWGAETENGYTTMQRSPTQLRGLSPVVQIHSSSTHTLLIDDSLHMYSFGTNNKGELGNGQPHLIGLTQVGIVNSLSALVVASGNEFSMALMRGEAPKELQVKKTDLVKAGAKTKDANFKVDYGHLNVDGHISEAEANTKITNLLAQMSNAGLQNNEGGPAPATSPAAPAPEAIPAAAPVPEPVPESVPVQQPVAAAEPADEAPKEKKKKKKKGRWKAVTDPNTGREYYFHTKTRETRWIKPDDMDAE